jgi:tetratricopeptide (TPR) repeat protein
MALGGLVNQIVGNGLCSLSDTLKFKKLIKMQSDGILSFEEMNWLGGYYLKKKEYIKAEYFAKKLLEVDPKNLAILNSLFEIYYFSNNYIGAIEIVQTLINEGEDLAIHYFNLGYCYYKLGDLKKSQEYKNKAIEIDSTFSKERYK